jgi:hypothetical protein
MKRMLAIVTGALALTAFLLEGIAFSKAGSADPGPGARPTAKVAATPEAATSSQPLNSIAQEPQSADEEGASADNSSAEEQEGPAGAAPEQSVGPSSEK